MLADAEERISRINRLVNMEEVLCEESLGKIRDALAGLRHINLTVTQIANFHSSGELGEAMENLQVKVAAYLSNAEEQYKILAALYP